MELGRLSARCVDGVGNGVGFGSEIVGGIEGYFEGVEDMIVTQISRLGFGESNRKYCSG